MRFISSSKDWPPADAGVVEKQNVSGIRRMDECEGTGIFARNKRDRNTAVLHGVRPDNRHGRSGHPRGVGKDKGKRLLRGNRRSQAGLRAYQWDAYKAHKTAWCRGGCV